MKFRLGKTIFSLSYPLVGIMTAVLLIDTSMNVVICFAAAVMHECGHIIAMSAFHTPPEEIHLTLFDIAIIDRKKHLHPFSHELVIVLAGIAVNFVSALLGYIFCCFAPHPLLISFVTAHLTLGVFNALPVDSLDGGQAVLLILTRYLTLSAAERVLNILSVLILIPTACFGFCILLSTRYNFTLLLAALYLTALLLLKKRKQRFHWKKI